jgi:hypothetical protein
VPSIRTLLEDVARQDPTVDALTAAISEELADLPEDVVRGRGWMLTRLIVDTCAEYEGAVSTGATPPRWADFGHFLTDSCAGLLTAPVGDHGVSTPVASTLLL